MKRNRYTLMLLLIAFTAITQNIHAQDTTIVETFTYESTERSGEFAFPDVEGETYERILMQYSMRCHDLAVGNGAVGCREWDYHCNTVLTDPSQTDSLRATAPSHTITGFSGDNVSYTTSPVFNTVEMTQKEVKPINTIDERLYTIGRGSDILDNTLFNSSNSKDQHLFTANELSTSGLEADTEITGIILSMDQGDQIDFLRVKIRATEQAELDPNQPELEGFKEVYFRNTPLQEPGENFLRFYDSFVWDGVSNLLLEFTHTSPQSPSTTFRASDNNFISGLTTNTSDKVIELSASKYLEVNTENLSQIRNEITIAFWAYGSTNDLPVNTYAFEGKDGGGARQVNLHLPWGDRKVYWDCGNDGSGYDRISKTATDEEIAGKWNHWAMTKNATTGIMQIYLNGALWHEGTEHFHPIDIKTFNIGANIDRNTFYYGQLDDFAVFDKALGKEEIQSLMHHAWYTADGALLPDHLITYFSFDDAINNRHFKDFASGNEQGAKAWNITTQVTMRGNKRFKGFTSTKNRPQISFVQGEYELDIKDIPVSYEEAVPAKILVSFDVDNNNLIPTDSAYVWLAGYQYTFDENGIAIDSTAIETENDLSISELTYYRKWPMRFELLSFITPYGNGLDLGPDGKMWTFDVTDFAPILKGNKQLSIEGVGNYQEEYGITFLFIKGTPARNVKSIQQIWPINRSNEVWYGRGYEAIVEDRLFEPRDILLDPTASSYKVRAAMTGHGARGEFVPQQHFVNLNGGEKEFQWEGWKKCGDNPVYPQGGTWIFDRAGWCPGMATDVQEFELTPLVVAGETISLDYGIEADSDLSESNYRTSVQLVTYDEPNFELDISIVDVIKPSNKVEYDRINPSCNNPVVVIQNNGTTPLSILEFEYGVTGGGSQTYFAGTDLQFNEKTELTLPTDAIDFWLTEEENPEFWVKVKSIYGEDQNPQNNEYRSPFNKTDRLEGPISIYMLTNKQAGDNSYTLKNQLGTPILSRNNLKDQTEYDDEIELFEGCYSLELLDSGGDGLYFWYWAQIGYDFGFGSFAVRDSTGNFIKEFGADFGSSINYDFSVYQDRPDSIDTAIETELGYRLFSLYPNPSNGQYQIELHGFENQALSLRLFNVVGQQLVEEKLPITGELQRIHNLNIETLPDGIYLLELFDGQRKWVKRISKQ